MKAKTLKQTAPKKVAAKPKKKAPKPGTWAAIVAGAEYAKKAGLQNWPG